MDPYLDGETRERFDRWHATLERRHTRDLTFTEIRKGTQALSMLYGGRSARKRDPRSALDGAGKRAAFSLYFAPLHFLTVYHVVREIGFDALAVSRLWDLGCGTGAAGAAWGAAILASEEAPAPRLVGGDTARLALQEAPGTYRAFGLKGEARKLDLGESPLRMKDPILLAWTVNELAPAAQARVLEDLKAGARHGRPLLVLEPVARKVAPWWSRWERALGEGALAAHIYEFRKRLSLPEWIGKMDKAASLDHRELTARVLAVVP